MPDSSMTKKEAQTALFNASVKNDQLAAGMECRMNKLMKMHRRWATMMKKMGKWAKVAL